MLKWSCFSLNKTALLSKTKESLKKAPLSGVIFLDLTFCITVLHLHLKVFVF